MESTKEETMQDPDRQEQEREEDQRLCRRCRLFHFTPSSEDQTLCFMCEQELEEEFD